MYDTLRIRDYVSLGQTATYMGVEDRTGRRDSVKCSASREVVRNGQKVLECVTFVPDTFHNRCLFLLQRSIEEVSFFAGEAFRKLGPEWAEQVFAPCLGAPAAPSQAAATPPAGSEEVDIVIGGLEDFLKLKKADQVKTVNTEGCPVELLRAVAECTDEALSVQARKLATAALNDLADADGPAAGDGTDDQGASTGDAG